MPLQLYVIFIILASLLQLLSIIAIAYSIAFAVLYSNVRFAAWYHQEVRGETIRDIETVTLGKRRNYVLTAALFSILFIAAEVFIHLLPYLNI